MSITESPNSAPATDDTRAEEAPTLPPFVERSSSATPATEGPTMVPPSATTTDGAAEEAITAATWHNAKKVTRLYHAGANNSWIALEGVGWKRVNPANPAACTAITMIAAHAVESGTTVNAYEATDGTIQTIYAW